jgi:hypothetical protein
MEQSPSEASSISARQETPVCHGTWRAMTVFKRTCNLSLSWNVLIESMLSYVIPLKPILILFFPLHLCLPSGLFLSRLRVCISLICHMSHMPRPSHYLVFDHSNNTWWGVKILEHIMQYCPVPYGVGLSHHDIAVLRLQVEGTASRCGFNCIEYLVGVSWLGVILHDVGWVRV